MGIWDNREFHELFIGGRWARGSSYSQSQHVKKPSFYDEELDYKEGDEDSKWNSYLNLSNSEISSQEKGSCSLDFVEENNDISFETFGRNQNLKSDLSNEVFDVSF